jgi:hypothetical protein
VGRAKGESKIRWWLADFKQQFARPTAIGESLEKWGLYEQAGRARIEPLAWLTDGTVLIPARRGDSNNIWGMRVSADGTLLDAPRRWTGGTTLESHASATVAADRTVRLAYDAINVTTGIRRIPLTSGGTPAGPPQPMFEEYGNIGSPSISADGSRLAFDARQPHNQFIRVMDVASGQAATVATIQSPRTARPVLSGDGRILAYWTSGGDNSGYLMSSKGGVPDAVCSHCGPPTDAGLDGSAVLFESGDTTNQLLLCARGAAARPIARVVDAPSLYMSAGRWSPDHRWILFCGKQDRRMTVYLVPVTPNGAVTASQLVPVSGREYDAWEPAWAPDGKHVYFVAKADGFGCIWGRDIDPASGQPSGAVFPVAHFHRARELVRGSSAYPGEIGLSVSRQFLVFSVTEIFGEVWLHTVSPLRRQ